MFTVTIDLFGEEDEDMEFEGFTDQLSWFSTDEFLKFKPI